MRISSPRGTILAACLAALTIGAPVHAFDPSAVFSNDEEPATILRFGYNALKEGRVEDAVGAFRFGVERRDLASTWKLARMLQIGEGVPRDDAAAFELFLSIAERYVTQVPTDEDTPFVSHAIVSVGVFYLNGLPAAGIHPDVRAAEDHFYRAAALYGDAEAQYRLGWLLRSGRLGRPQGQAAARWLKLAARKGHRAAQSELGDILFHGDGVHRNRVQGLYLMTRGAMGQTTARLTQRARQALEAATPAERRELSSLLRSGSDGKGAVYGLELPARNGAASRPVSATR